MNWQICICICFYFKFVFVVKFLDKGLMNCYDYEGENFDKLYSMHQIY